MRQVEHAETLVFESIREYLCADIFPPTPQNWQRLVQICTCETPIVPLYWYINRARLLQKGNVMFGTQTSSRHSFQSRRRHYIFHSVDCHAQYIFSYAVHGCSEHCAVSKTTINKRGTAVAPCAVVFGLFRADSESHGCGGNIFLMEKGACKINSVEEPTIHLFIILLCLIFELIASMESCWRHPKPLKQADKSIARAVRHTRWSCDFQAFCAGLLLSINAATSMNALTTNLVVLCCIYSSITIVNDSSGRSSCPSWPTKLCFAEICVGFCEQACLDR